jgi:hypothetical protein
LRVVCRYKNVQAMEGWMVWKHRACALWLVVAALAWACGRPPAQVAVEQKSPADSGPTPVPHSRDADDTARFFAGLPGTPGSPFAELETSAAWQEHRRRMDAAWRQAEAQFIDSLRTFQQEELSGAPMRDATVFYPFSGPDALTPILCFPHSPVYVLVALEPVGTLPALARIEKKNLPSYLATVRNTVASELGRSFFVTREMDREFRGQVTDGLLLPIALLLERSGHTILGFRYVRLDAEGQMVGRPAGWQAPGKIGNKGVEIEFRTDADQSIHRLCYFSVNLSDVRLRQNDPFLAYAGRLKGTSTLLKATSYMTHHEEFSAIRDLVLATSGSILQDDSGIPYHCFTPGPWKVTLYGHYERPYGSFRWLEQKDLRKAYQAPDVKPLPVSIGYGFRKVASNLLLARRD